MAPSIYDIFFKIGLTLMGLAGLCIFIAIIGDTWTKR